MSVSTRLALLLTVSALLASTPAPGVTVEADPPEAGDVVVASTEPAASGVQVVLEARARPGFLFLYWSADGAASYANFMLTRTTATAPAETSFTAHFIGHDNLRDEDSDLILDDWEEAYADVTTSAGTADADADLDDLTSLQEARYLCRPNRYDSDGDGLPDGWEVAVGLDPCNAADAAGDLDGDGIANRDEFTRLGVLDTITLQPGWNAISVWNPGPITLDPAHCALPAYRWDAARQRFVAAADLSRVSPGEAILVYCRSATAFSSWGHTGYWVGGVGCSAGPGVPTWHLGVWYNLTVTAFPAGAGTVSPLSASVPAASPTPIGISASPAFGYKFLFWTATVHADVADPLAAITQVMLSGDARVTANFRPHEGLLDADGDRLLDTWETAYRLDPLDAADATADADGDGLDNLGEHRNGTDPRGADSDGDGIGDGVEVAARLDPLSAADADLDADGDGLSNLEEARLGRPLDGVLLYPGWNLISLARPATLSAATSIGPLYRLDPLTQRLVELPADALLNPGYGYWCFCPHLAELDIHTGRIVALQSAMQATTRASLNLRPRTAQCTPLRPPAIRGRMTQTLPRVLR